MPTTTPAILCRDLVRIFQTDGVEVQALQGLNLLVQPGELLAVVGASGSGKSTLLTILSGLDTPTAGVASVAGANLLAMSRRQRLEYRRHTVGFVWQQTGRNLLPYLTAAENIATVLALAGRRDRASRIDDLAQLLRIGDGLGLRPAEMSGGMRQRVALAVGLANAPQVLLADEPTGELDEDASTEVLEAIREANEEVGVTTLIVTHDPAVSDHVRRTVQIRDGRTSTETMRSLAVGAANDGDEPVEPEVFAVLDRVGRLQLPADYVTALDLADRVRLALEPDHLGVWPTADRSPIDRPATDRPTEDQR
jgi:ABC-type lipoprotein export system ATPase subunit